jgi:tetratricopeptide (TPR) repeat protein
MDRTEMLKQFLAENPNDAFARYGLALEYVNAGQIDSGLEEFKTILRSNPDYTPAYQMAAQALLGAQRNQEARQLLEDGIACARRTGNQKALSEMQALLDELGT